MDKNLLKIRKVTSNDAREWTIFGLKIWRDAYKNIFPEQVFIDRESKLEEKIKTFDDKIQNNDRNIAYVAEYNGKIIGTMCGSIKSSYEDFSEYADLIGLYIDSRFQGLGISTKFKEIFEEWASKNGASQYVIGVLKDNTKARNVYEHWGGKLSEFERDFVKLGVGYKEVFYTYALTKN